VLGIRNAVSRIVYKSRRRRYKHRKEGRKRRSGRQIRRQTKFVGDSVTLDLRLKAALCLAAVKQIRAAPSEIGRKPTSIKFYANATHTRAHGTGVREATSLGANTNKVGYMCWKECHLAKPCPAQASCKVEQGHQKGALIGDFYSCRIRLTA
jgi:hypothetical protein